MGKQELVLLSAPPSSGSKLWNQSSFAWEFWFIENACYRVIKMTLSLYVMCFITTYSTLKQYPRSEIRKLSFGGVQLPGVSGRNTHQHQPQLKAGREYEHA